MKNLHTVGCTTLHSHQQYMMIPFFVLPQHLLLVFLVIPILIGVRWYLIVNLIGISTIITDFKHLSCASWPSLGLWRNVYSISSSHLLNWIVRFLVVELLNSLYILDINSPSNIWFAKNFLPFSRLPFCFDDGFFHYAEAAFCFDVIPFIHSVLFVSFFAYGVRSTEILLKLLSKSLLPPVLSSWKFMVSGFTSKSLTYFELIFVYGVSWLSSFILLHLAVQYCQHHLLNILSFLHCMFLAYLL